MKLDKEFFNQIKGTRMDTIFTPIYATLLMRYFETNSSLITLRKTKTGFWITTSQFLGVNKLTLTN